MEPLFNFVCKNEHCFSVQFDFWIKAQRSNIETEYQWKLDMQPIYCTLYNPFAANLVIIAVL